MKSRLLFFLLFLPANLFAQSNGKELSVAEIFNSTKFSGESVNDLHWKRDGKSLVYRETDKDTGKAIFAEYNLSTGKRSVLLKTPFKIENHARKVVENEHASWSPGEDYLLLTGTLRARGVKTGGNFSLYDVKSGRLRKVTQTDQTQVNIKFSPDGKSIGFARSNNLFVVDVESGQEKQLTFDGREHIINGDFDWVYEEEFGVTEGWQWSPDSRFIAYWQLDEQRIPGFDIAEYDSLHLNWIHMRYPKAGDPNSTVKIGAVNVASGENIWMDIGTQDDIYIPRMQWLPDSDKLAMLRLNRLQNQVELLLGDPETGKTEVVLAETDDRWIEMDDDLTFLGASNQFLWTSEKDGFNHIYLHSMNGRLVKQLTEGAWEVRNIVTVDENDGVVYFMATEKSPLENHLYQVDLDGRNFKRITRTPGWHSVQFSPSKEHYIDTYSRADQPEKIGLFTRKGKLKDILVENPIKPLSDYTLRPPEFFNFETTDGVRLNGYMIKPPNFDEKKAYPVLMYVYGGPGSQTVRDRWGGKRYLWFQALAQKGYVIASVDNRGTGARGADFKKLTYKNLGHWEVNDQIEAARYLGSLAYVDKDRIGIFGWSYGGYMASFCLFRGADVFKSAISVAPVTHWKYYDTIYTERYMQTPKLNPEGYRKSAPLNYVDQLRGSLLLIHGTSDDNVHFQNSVDLANELIAHNKQFDTMFYPGRFHGIRERAKNTQEHIYTLMTNFILEKL